MNKLARMTFALSFVLMTSTISPAFVQDAATPPPADAAQQPAPAEAQPAPVEVQPAPAPVVVESKADPLIFKRTINIDGKIDSGEWDTFTSMDVGSDKLTTFADWDSSNLYLAVTGSKAIKLTAFIDASGDGWYHGGDNYKIVLSPGSEGAVAVEMSKYDSRDANGTALPVNQPVSLLAKLSGDGKTMEIAIPQGSLIGLKLGNGKTLGLRLFPGFTDGTPAQQQAPENLVQSTLVSSKSAALAPIQIELDLRDSRLAQGEELVGKLTIRNMSKERIDAGSFVVGGEGRAAQYLNSEMVRLEGLNPGAKIKRTFRTKIPKDMSSGCWGLGAEVRGSSGRIGGTLVSFEVASSYEVTMDAGEEPFVAGSSDWRIVNITTKNYTQYRTVGEVKITLPDGWQVLNNDNTKMISIPEEDSFYTATFRVKPTDQAKQGHAQIKADVKIGKTVVSTSQTVEVGK